MKEVSLSIACSLIVRNSVGILGLVGYVEWGKKKFDMGKWSIILIVLISKVKH